MDVSDIFNSAREGGKRVSEATRLREGGGGGQFFIESTRRGGVSRTGGAEGPGGCLRQEFLGGGGLNIFFSGAKCPPSFGVSRWT